MSTLQTAALGDRPGQNDGFLLSQLVQAAPGEGASNWNSCLWLRNCGQQDAGKYSCRAQNERGQACCEAVVTVLEVGDLETGEDDISDVQGTQRLELRGDRTFSTPTGGSDTLVGTSLDTPPTSMTGTSEEQVSWWGSGQTVLEQEVGSRGGTRRLPGSPSSVPQSGLHREEPDLQPQPASEAPRRPALPPPSKSALLPPPSP
ncbi:PREDICTED: striated muscle preferentially expressed protein kinase-like, partial [Myotis brandtii]|uniref:striated muscle preferentially expressed protein kinase-like n=1 Tax=Myotis brandtii TaxID=109478 RepID=UPI000704351F